MSTIPLILQFYFIIYYYNYNAYHTCVHTHKHFFILVGCHTHLPHLLAVPAIYLVLVILKALCSRYVRTLLSSKLGLLLLLCRLPLPTRVGAVWARRNNSLLCCTCCPCNLANCFACLRIASRCDGDGATQLLRNKLRIPNATLACRAIKIM